MAKFSITSTPSPKKKSVGPALIRSSQAAIRWNCPGSILEERDAPPQQPSEAAELGTKAHDWAARAVLEGPGVLEKLDDLEMREHVRKYAELIERLEKKVGGFDEVWVEQKVIDIPGVHEGTSDFAALYDGKKKLVIVDFKYGENVSVLAEENYQLLSYLRCVIKHHDLRVGGKDGISQAVCIIFQPRARDGFGAFRKWKLEATEIQDWSKKIDAWNQECIEVRDGKRAGVFQAGSHCRWCRAYGKCQTNLEYLNKQSLMQIGTEESVISSPAKFNPKKIANTLTPEQVSNILAVESEIKKILTSVKEYAIHAATKMGVEFPGFKVVEGKAFRKARDDISEQEFVNELKRLGVSRPYKDRVIKGVTEVEKEIGKGKVDHLYIKGEGRPTLAPMDSPKPALNLTSPVDMFDNLEEQEDE